MRLPRADELTDRGAVHDYRVLYPSGQQFMLRGVYCVMGIKGEVSPAIRVDDSLMVLDPRAVVTRGDLIIYDPRRSPAVAGWVRDWLAEHPEWPHLATETQ